MLPVKVSSHENGDASTTTSDSVLLCSARSFMWPDENSLVMEVRVARSVLESELLVQEDEEFLNNFILNEEVSFEINTFLIEKIRNLIYLFQSIGGRLLSTLFEQKL